jgi:hypothetical protein
LEVDLFAARRALTAAARGLVRVGRLVRTSLHAGIVRFSVSLDAAARQALARHRRLVLIVELGLASPRGVRAAARRRVVLHARG